MKQQILKQNDGFALVTVMFLITIFASLLGAYMILSQTELKLAKASRDSASGFNAAEAGLNIRAENIRNIFKNFDFPSGTSPSSINDCIAGSGGSGDFVCETFNFDNDHSAATMVKPDPGNPVFTTIPPGEQFGGLSTQEFRYAVTSVGRNSLGTNEAIFDLTFKSRLVPMFQFAAFFEEDLEIFNGATLELDGPVHTNGDYYLAPQTGGTTRLTGQITSSGNLYRGRKDGNSCSGFTGNLEIQDPISYLTLPACSGNRFQITDVENWNNNILLNEDPVKVPSAEETKAFSDGEYWQHADLRLVLQLRPNGTPDTSNSSTGVEVINVDGTLNSAATQDLHNNTCSISGYQHAPVKRVSGVDPSSVHSQWSSVNSSYQEQGLVWDHTTSRSRPIGNTYFGTPDLPWGGRNRLRLFREHNWNSSINNYETTLEIDLQALLRCIGQYPSIMDGKSLNDTTEQGLVLHLTVNGPRSELSHNNYAVRVRNGAEIESSNSSHPAVKGLAIVTDQKIVVWGDYNSDSNWKPASLIADTHFLLSNNWRDLYSGYPNVATCPFPWCASLIHRRGSSTEVQAGVLSAIKRTGNANGPSGQDIGAAGGGLINIFRFNEHYRQFGSTLRNQTFSYNGSFVSLGAPLHSQSNFEPFNYYSAPNRSWSYDENFNNPDKLPPMTPSFVYLRQELFVRDFKL